MVTERGTSMSDDLWMTGALIVTLVGLFFAPDLVRFYRKRKYHLDDEL